MTTTAHDNEHDNTTIDARQERFEAQRASAVRVALLVAVSLITVHVASASALQRWADDISSGWPHVLVAAAVFGGLIVGGDLSDRIGARQLFSTSIVAAIANTAIAVIVPFSPLAVASMILATGATAIAVVAGLLMLVGDDKTDRPGRSIAIVLGAPAALLAVRPTLLGDAGTEPLPIGVACALIAIAAVAARAAVRSTPEDVPIEAQAPTAIYDAADLRVLRTARLLIALAIGAGCVALLERTSGQTDQGPLLAAAGCLVVFGSAAAFMLRAKLLSLFDLASTIAPSVGALIAAAALGSAATGAQVALGAQAGMSDMAFDQRIAGIVILGGLPLSTIALTEVVRRGRIAIGTVAGAALAIIALAHQLGRTIVVSTIGAEGEAASIGLGTSTLATVGAVVAAFAIAAAAFATLITD